MTPVGAKADIPKMAKLGNKGVSLLLSDSTSSLVNDYSISEKEVSKAVDYEIRTAKGRVIVATFASNVNRVREIINAAIKN
ncbi:MAG: ribonuclease J, partial [Tenericutes bacterium]